MPRPLPTLAGCKLKLISGEIVTVIHEIVGVTSGLDINGKFCIPVQVESTHQRFVRMWEVETVVSTPEEGYNAKLAVQSDIRSFGGGTGYYGVDRPANQQQERYCNG